MLFKEKESVKVVDITELQLAHLKVEIFKKLSKYFVTM